MSSRGDAGAYAEERFRRGRSSWRVRIRWIALACFGPFILAGLVAPFLVQQPVAIWGAGVILGAGLGGWIAVANSPPGYIENWRTGAEGERKTAKQLRALDDAWLVAHDIDAGRGNYDHVALGPAGVFLLDTKSPSGVMRIEGGRLRVTPHFDPDAEIRYPNLALKAKVAAARLRRELGAVWVEPVVVLWCEFPAGIQTVDGCTFIHGDRVADWLEAQPSKLSETRVAELRTALEGLALKSRG